MDISLCPQQPLPKEFAPGNLAAHTCRVKVPLTEQESFPPWTPSDLESYRVGAGSNFFATFLFVANTVLSQLMVLLKGDLSEQFFYFNNIS